MSKNNPGRKGGIIGFGVTALVLGSIFSTGGLSIMGIAVIGGVAYVVGKVVGIMTTPLDTTTHNREDKPVREIEKMAKETTGNEVADDVIAKGQEMLLQIRAVNKAIPDQRLSEQMYQLESMCLSMFRTVVDQPAKAGQIRKFINYYLPTTLKMLNNYRIMQDRGVSRSELLNARETLIRGMDMVLVACQKQIDNLYKSDMLDITTDIDVLEQMLRRDGFTDGGLGNVPFDGTAITDPETYTARPMAAAEDPMNVPDTFSARTAASATLSDHARPTLFVDADGDGMDDYTGKPSVHNKSK